MDSASRIIWICYIFSPWKLSALQHWLNFSVSLGGRILFGLEDPPFILFLDRTGLGLNTLWYYYIYMVVWTRLTQACVEWGALEKFLPTGLFCSGRGLKIFMCCLCAFLFCGIVSSLTLLLGHLAGEFVLELSLTGWVVQGKQKKVKWLHRESP